MGGLKSSRVVKSPCAFITRNGTAHWMPAFAGHDERKRHF
jgi:hypothetical protein